MQRAFHRRDSRTNICTHPPAGAHWHSCNEQVLSTSGSRHCQAHPMNTQCHSWRTAAEHHVPLRDWRMQGPQHRRHSVRTSVACRAGASTDRLHGHGSFPLPFTGVCAPPVLAPFPFPFPFPFPPPVALMAAGGWWVTRPWAKGTRSFSVTLSPEPAVRILTLTAIQNR